MINKTKLSNHTSNTTTNPSYRKTYPKKKKKNQDEEREKRKTSATLDTARISENAKREGFEVASMMIEARKEPLFADTCFTKCSIKSACFCSISIVCKIRVEILEKGGEL